MKIAILTHPLGKNYGGMMQAFALQRILTDLGHDAVTLNIQPVKVKTFYIFKRFIYRLYLKILGKRKAPIRIEAKFKYLFQYTDNFVKKYIKTTEEITDTKGLQKYFQQNTYGAIIVGSDQTWRPRYVADIYNYYLDFLKDKPIKKLAYASSFGVDVWEYTDEQTQVCKNLAKKFDAISVREQTGIELCREYLDVKSTCVLDPTLLLDKEDYLTIFDIDSQKNAGVFSYWLDNNTGKNFATKKLAEKLNTHSYSSQAVTSLTKLDSSILDDYIMPPVEQWLASFSNAQAVLTDSFHGMVFSIIFEKPFVVVANKERGASRFQSLLEKLGLEDRLVNDASEITAELLSRPLPQESYIKLQELKNQSKQFLQKNLI